MFDTSVSHRLFHSFMQFRRVKWLGTHNDARRPSDIRMLFCIQRGQEAEDVGMKVSEISSALHVSAPTVTQLVNALEQRGLVERKMDNLDRRVIRVRLTDEGKRETNEARKRTQQWFSGLVDYLGEEESDHLARLLAKVQEYASGETSGKESGGEAD